MDVLGILRENGKDLIPEELDLLRVELDTGGYDEAYISTCRQLISDLSNWSGKENVPEENQKDTDIRIPNDCNSNTSAKNEVSVIQSFSNIPPEEIIAVDLQRMRADRDYKSLFKKYIKESNVINEEFIVAHFSLFKNMELNAMLSCIPFSEDFLEHYFSVLDPKAISLHQRFSENFFIKHFAALDADAVLKRGVNPWRIKTLRSKMLSNFLRIKGVKV